MDAVSLLYHLPSLPVGVVSELAATCSDPAVLDRDVRSFVLEVMHHRRRSLSPSAYLGFLVSILTASAEVRNSGGGKRTAGQQAGGVGVGGGTTGGGGGGKRRRQRPGASRGGDGGPPDDEPSKELAEAAAAAAEPSSAPPTLWETVFGRDEVTGAVCNSLAMIGTRGGALLGALQPTLLQLLRHRSKRGDSGGVGGKRGKKQAPSGESGGGGSGGGGGGDFSVLQSLDEEPAAALLQGQRAAMACVLCCWEGLDSATAPPPSPAPAGTAKAARPSPLSALEKPMAAACVRAMKAAGTAEAAEKARGARLLRPVLILVKRWPALLPLMLALIVQASSEAPSAAAPSVEDGEGGATPMLLEDGVVTAGGGGSRSSSLEPILRCLQTVVRDPGLQGQLRRRHVGVLRESASKLGEALEGTPLRDVVLQLRADVDVLGGGVVDE
ncbi:unnamed protein product [Scytosiphon promiscuus]